jgi:hypothetical protein
VIGIYGPDSVQVLFSTAVVKTDLDFASSEGNGFVMQRLVDVADEMDDVRARAIARRTPKRKPYYKSI